MSPRREVMINGRFFGRCDTYVGRLTEGPFP